MKKKDEIKVCLVGSSGGHLTHLYLQHYRQPLPQQETTDCYHEPDPDGVEEPAGYRTRPYL